MPCVLTLQKYTWSYFFGVSGLIHNKVVHTTWWWYTLYMMYHTYYSSCVCLKNIAQNVSTHGMMMIMMREIYELVLKSSRKKWLMLPAILHDCRRRFFSRIQSKTRRVKPICFLNVFSILCCGKCSVTLLCTFFWLSTFIQFLHCCYDERVQSLFLHSLRKKRKSKPTQSFHPSGQEKVML